MTCYLYIYPAVSAGKEWTVQKEKSSLAFQDAIGDREGVYREVLTDGVVYGRVAEVT